MKCSAFIATSSDGFIAKLDGNVDWLHTAGNQQVDMGEQADMGFNAYLSSIDCIIMGRKCMEVISSMNLAPEQWPYGSIRIVTLSKTLSRLPKNLADKMELHTGSIEELIDLLQKEGHTHAYVDGGTTIRSFIELQVISELIITKAPVVLGEGIPLLTNQPLNFELLETKHVQFPNEFEQIRYKVNYPETFNSK